MTNLLLRHKGLGRSSCAAIQSLSENPFNILRNDKPFSDIPEVPEFVFRWGCTASLPDNYTAESIVINSREAIKVVSNKAKFRLAMQEVGIKIPFTVNNWADLADFHWDGAAGMSWIIRPIHHAGGSDLFFAASTNNALEIIESNFAEEDEWYASEYIRKDREFRIYCVSGRVVCVAEKFVDDSSQIAWNNSLGGSFRNVTWANWPLQACEEALSAMELAGLDFGGVDVIQKDGADYVLEINSAPTLSSRYRQECFTKAFDWIIEHNHISLGLPDYPIVTWKHIIHPAISEKAIV